MQLYTNSFNEPCRNTDTADQIAADQIFDACEIELFKWQKQLHYLTRFIFNRANWQLASLDLIKTVYKETSE